MGLAIQRVGGLVLVPADDVGRLLDALEHRGVRVLGAEGFRLRGREVRPDMDAILDISDVADLHESIREARSFVEDVATPDLLFAFVIDDELAAR
jgi:hypothetical protein